MIDSYKFSSLGESHKSFQKFLDLNRTIKRVETDKTFQTEIFLYDMFFQQRSHDHLVSPIKQLNNESHNTVYG